MTPTRQPRSLLDDPEQIFTPPPAHFVADLQIPSISGTLYPEAPVLLEWGPSRVEAFTVGLLSNLFSKLLGSGNKGQSREPTHARLEDVLDSKTLALVRDARTLRASLDQQAAPMDLHFSNIDTQELAQCASGDRLNLWLCSDQSFVNAYRRGNVGGQGRVATLWCKDNPGLLDAMTEGRPVWLTVERRTDSSYAFELHMTTAEEFVTQRKQAENQRRIELLTPYSPKKPILVEMRAPETVTFHEGQQLTFKDESIDHYAASPSAALEFIIASTAPLAFVSAGTNERKRILRAHFSGFTIHAQVTKVSPEPVNAGNATSIWKEASATVRISFTR